MPLKPARFKRSGTIGRSVKMALVADLQSQPAGLVRLATGLLPDSMERQTLTESGNVIFRATLGDGRSVVLRISPRPRAFAFTGQNLDALRGLGLPVQRVLGSGPTSTGGSFMVLDWLPGRDLIDELPTMTPGQMTDVARTVVDGQRRIGTLPRGRGFGWGPVGGRAGAATWSELFGPNGDGGVAGPTSPLADLKARLRAVRRSIESYLSAVLPVCFLDDLTIKNVLVDGGVVSGIIDVDSVCYGDPLMSVGTTIALIAANSGRSIHVLRRRTRPLLESARPGPAGNRFLRRPVGGGVAGGRRSGRGYRPGGPIADGRGRSAATGRIGQFGPESDTDDG